MNPPPDFSPLQLQLTPAMVAMLGATSANHAEARRSHPAGFVVFGMTVPPAFDLYPLDLDMIRHVAVLARVCDRVEIGACQPGGYDADALSAEMVQACAHGFVATADDVPVAVVGLCPVMPGVFSAGMFATYDWFDVARHVTRYVRDIFIPERVAEGMRRMEARSIVGHPSAGRWLVHLGFVHEGTCRDFGMRGEAFHLYGWRRSDHV